MKNIVMEGKFVKKRLLFTNYCHTFSLILVTPTFTSKANEKDQELETLSENKGEIIYQDDEITVRSFGNNPEIADAIFNNPDSVVGDNSVEVNEKSIMPFASINGPGGRSSIVAGNTGRIVYWSVKPATLWPYSFTGLVKLRYHSGFKRDAPIGGLGAIGSTVSGEVTMNKNNGGVAYLSGTAYSVTGSKYTVLTGVHESF